MLGLSGFSWALWAASNSTLPIDIVKGCAANRNLGVSLYRELPNIVAGEKFSFLGRYDLKDNRIYFLDPPWVHVIWPRRLHWRIYFSVGTGRGSSKAISHYLEPNEAEALVQLPSVQNYIKGAEASGHYSRSVDYPRISLYDVYAGKVPEKFENLNARKTLVRLFCDNLGDPRPNLQQAFFATTDSNPLPLNSSLIGRFTGTIHPNRPELSYRAKSNKNFHHFNLELTDIEPIKVTLREDTVRSVFVEEIQKAETRLRAICEKEGLAYRFSSLSGHSLTWFDERMVITGLITALPSFSFQPVPYMVASVLINPESGKPERIVCGLRIRQDPPD